jgi:hypothetical protein
VTNEEWGIEWVGRRSNLLVLELGLELDTRVRDVSTFLDGVLLGNTSGVLEEDDTLVVLDKLFISGVLAKVKRRTTQSRWAL